VFIDNHDWLGYMAGVVTITRSYSTTPFKARVDLYRDGAIVQSSGWLYKTSGTSLTKRTNWDASYIHCWYAEADFVNTWPNGQQQTVNNLASNEICT
jgi:hypothetical protein